MRAFLFALVSGLILVLAANVPTRADERLTIFAAASLKGTMDEAARIFEEKTGHPAVVSFASSSALAKQIEAGAPADLFISADRRWMDFLVERGMVKAEAVTPYLSNRIVIVAPLQSDVSITIAPDFPLVSALKGGRLAMGEPNSVPAGIYGKEALGFFGIWQAVEPHVAGAENVRSALKLVSRGEAPLGIVYATDARAEPEVKVVAVFPQESHPAIVYPLAPVLASKNPNTRAFLDFLMTDEARAIFTRAGFALSGGA